MTCITAFLWCFVTVFCIISSVDLFGRKVWVGFRLSANHQQHFTGRGSPTTCHWNMKLSLKLKASLPLSLSDTRLSNWICFSLLIVWLCGSLLCYDVRSESRARANIWLHSSNTSAMLIKDDCPGSIYGLWTALLLISLQGASLQLLLGCYIFCLNYLVNQVEGISEQSCTVIQITDSDFDHIK